jgi:hypothetical protein
VGLCELNAFRSYLRLMLVRLLKIEGWPDNPAVSHWLQEMVPFQSDAAQRFAPSMRHQIEISVLCAGRSSRSGIPKPTMRHRIYGRRSALRASTIC